MMERRKEERQREEVQKEERNIRRKEGQEQIGEMEKNSGSEGEKVQMQERRQNQQKGAEKYITGKAWTTAWIN